MRLDTSWLFNLGADIYAWFTAQAAWRASCAALVERLPAGDGLRVVDLGCGPGVSTFELARRRPGAQVIGLDVASRMLGEARRRQKRMSGTERIGWVRADASRLPFRVDAVDALTGHSFLYLLPRRDAVLAECVRVLRPGGRLALMEPNARPTSVRRVLDVSHDVRHLVSVSLWRPFSRLHGQFSAASLAETLRGAGFVNCQVDETLGGLGLLARADKPRGSSRSLPLEP
jgi:ubiquinone/menaquinone biosynthesis C-methylase UbiE